MEVESILQKCTEVIEYPFPHIVIKNALSDEYYQALFESMPDWKEVVYEKNHHKSNYRGNISCYDIIKNPHPQIWKDFINFHTSSKFFKEFIRWFGPYVQEHLPLVEKKFGNLKNLRVNPRNKEKTWGRFCLDALISATTPVTEMSSIRGKHIDGNNKLFAGMLYMRDPEDNAGGDLELYECSGKPTFCRQAFSNVSYPHMEKVGEIKYEANSFVVLLNTQTSVHSVSPRQITDKSRRFVNFYGQFNQGIIRAGGYGHIRTDKV